MKACNPSVLTEGNGVIITFCKTCDQLGFMYFNYVLRLDREAFTNFKEYLMQADFVCDAIMFPDGIPRIVIPTTSHKINLTFSQAELEDVKEKVCEAEALLEVYDVLD